ncbi:MAG: hypothetical protein HQ553_08905 [Chloroflexi bacterium]|nr:hypothetical protein [Chloroflexota bacterium]
MGVRNWLANRSSWKGWGVSATHDSSSENKSSEEIDVSDRPCDDYTRVFLQELQEIASQLKESKRNKTKKD